MNQHHLAKLKHIFSGTTYLITYYLKNAIMSRVNKPGFVYNTKECNNNLCKLTTIRVLSTKLNQSTRCTHLPQVAVHTEPQCVFHKCISSKHEHEALCEKVTLLFDFQNRSQEPSGSHNLQIDLSSLSTIKSSMG